MFPLTAALVLPQESDVSVMMKSNTSVPTVFTIYDLKDVIYSCWCHRIDILI